MPIYGCPVQLCFRQGRCRYIFPPHLSAEAREGSIIDYTGGQSALTWNYQMQERHIHLKASLLLHENASFNYVILHIFPILVYCPSGCLLFSSVQTWTFLTRPKQGLLYFFTETSFLPALNTFLSQNHWSL